MGEEGDNKNEKGKDNCFVGPLPSLRAAISLFVCFSFLGGGGEGSTPC